MERLKTNKLGQWQIEDAPVEKATDEDRGAIEIKQRERMPQPKKMQTRIKEIKAENTAPKEPSLAEQIEQKKKQYADALKRTDSTSDLEPLEKMHLIRPRGAYHGFDLPTHLDVGDWKLSVPATGTDPDTGEKYTQVVNRDLRTNKPNLTRYAAADSSTSRAGYSRSALGSSRVASNAEMFKLLSDNDPTFRKLPKDAQQKLIEGHQNKARAHEVQHDIIGHLAGQVKHKGDFYVADGESAQRPFASYLIARANLSPSEAHLLHTSLSANGHYNLFEHPHEALAHVAEWLNSGSHVRDKYFDSHLAAKLPGETVDGFTGRLKDIHNKITTQLSQLRGGQEVSIPSDHEYIKAIHGAGWHHDDLNSWPDLVSKLNGHQFSDLSAGYAPHGAPKSQRAAPSMAVAKGLQPSSEQWEAAAAQMLGLPTDTATAEKLAKQAEERWTNSLADSFKALSQPVEKTQQTDFGRGPVDQGDESQLTEEEQRIRAIKVDPNLLSD